MKQTDEDGNFYDCATNCMSLDDFSKVFKVKYFRGLLFCHQYLDFLPSGSTSNTTAIPSNETIPACYTGQPWSDYENGARGLGLGASMIFVCFVELLMSIMSMACCWAATKVQPTEVSVLQ